MRNPVAVSMCPASAAFFARSPNAPRAGNWSASPPPNALPTAPRRSSHTIFVPGSCSARSASTTNAVSAECPLPATAIRLPAYRARSTARSGTR